MVQINDSGQYIRRKIERDDNLPESVVFILERLVRARLLIKESQGNDTSLSETYEVTHEALFWVWDRLATWLRENKDFLLWRRGLDEALKTWNDSQQDKELLLRGVQVTQAEEWMQKNKTDHR